MTTSEAEMLVEISTLREERRAARERNDLIRAYELSAEIGRLTAEIRRARMLAQETRDRDILRRLEAIEKYIANIVHPQEQEDNRE